MLRGYVGHLYTPRRVLARAQRRLRRARALAEWKHVVLAAGRRSHVDHVESSGSDSPEIGGASRCTRSCPLGG
jgi:starch phosphorylase